MIATSISMLLILILQVDDAAVEGSATELWRVAGGLAEESKGAGTGKFCQS